MRQMLALFPKVGSVVRAELPPRHGLHEPRSSKPVGTQNVFDKDPNWPLKSVKCIVQSDELPVVARSAYIFSGASIPSKSRARTSCASTSSVNCNRNARFCSSASDRMWCL